MEISQKFPVGRAADGSLASLRHLRPRKPIPSVPLASVPTTAHANSLSVGCPLATDNATIIKKGNRHHCRGSRKNRRRLQGGGGERRLGIGEASTADEGMMAPFGLGSLIAQNAQAPGEPAPTPRSGRRGRRYHDSLLTSQNQRRIRNLIAADRVDM